MALGGVGLILRSLGVNVTPEQVAQLEQFIPQVIPRAVQIIQVLNERIQFYNEQFARAEQQRIQLATDVQALHNKFDAKLDADLAFNQLLMEKLEAIHESIRNNNHGNDSHGTTATGNTRRGGRSTATANGGTAGK